MSRPTRRGWGSLGQSAVPGDVVKALDELGVEMFRQVGDEVQIRCPAHLRILGKEDTHPSCSVNVETGLVGCFSCKWSGNFVTIVIEMLGCSESDAYDWVRERGSIDRAKRMLGVSTPILQTREAEEITEVDLALFTQVPEEIAHRRNLTVASLDKYGVLWDARKGYWIIPVRDPKNGRLWGWQVKGEGKRIFRNHPEDLTKSKALFGARQFIPGSRAILVESPLDIVRLRDAGFHGGLSIYGSSVSRAQMSWLASNAHEVFLALDNDSAGRVGTQEFLDAFPYTQRVKIFNYAATSKKDVGDMNDVEIRWGINNAIWPGLWRKDGNHLSIQKRRGVRHGADH